MAEARNAANIAGRSAMSHAAAAGSLILAIIAVWLSIFTRDIEIDQGIFLLTAQQWLLGHPLYLDIQDVHPPPIYFLHALPVLLANLSGLSVIIWFNAVVSTLAVLSGVLFGLAAPRLKLVSGALWICVLLLGAHDYFFGQREYFFVLAWVPYVVCRCGSGNPRSWVQIASGILLGILICLKPHFALVVVMVEALLWLRFRAQSRVLPFIAFIASGAFQVVLFLAFFNVTAYFRDIADYGYYDALGVHYGEVVIGLLRSQTVWISALAAFLALWPLISDRRLRPLVEALLLTAVMGAILAVLQGTYREYYLILIYLPVAGLLVALICAPKFDAQFPLKLSRIVRAAWLLLAGFCLAIFAYSPNTGIVHLAGKRYVQGFQYQIYGGIFPDPFVQWVRAHVPADAPITVIAPQYGQEHNDPIISMLRLGRPMGSHTGVIMGFSIAEVEGNHRAGCAATEALRHEMLGNDSQWIFIRRAMPPWASAQSGDPLVHFQHYPGFWRWFTAHYAPTDQFNRYSVYRRIAAFPRGDTPLACL